MKKRLVVEEKKPQLGGKGKRKLRPPKSGHKRPDFKSLFDGHGRGDPLGGYNVEPMMGADIVATEEVSEALRRVLEERAQRRDEFRIATDRDYYAVICFQCEDQKREFLVAMGWLQNSFEERFLDGLEVAHSLGVDIKPIDLPMKMTKKRTPVKLRKQEVIR